MYRLIFLRTDYGRPVVLAHTQFGPTLTSAQKYFGSKQLRPKKYIGPVYTLALKYFGPKQLWPRNNFGPETTSAR